MFDKLGAILLIIAAVSPNLVVAQEQPQIGGPPLVGLAVGDNLESSHQIADVEFIYETFIAATERSKKGEFETNIEHQKRLKDLSTLVAPLNPNKAVILPIAGVKAAYDADRKGWSLATSFGYGCTRFSRKHSFWTCLSKRLKFEGEPYVGENAFGGQRVVDVVSVVEVNFIIQEGWIKDSRAYKEGMGGYLLQTFLPMEMDKAKSLGSNGIEAFIVGQIVTGELLRGRTDYQSPTYSNPERRTTRTVTLPIIPAKIVFISKNDGKIYGEINPWGY